MNKNTSLYCLLLITACFFNKNNNNSSSNDLISYTTDAIENTEESKEDKIFFNFMYLIYTDPLIINNLTTLLTPIANVQKTDERLLNDIQEITKQSEQYGVFEKSTSLSKQLLQSHNILAIHFECQLRNILDAASFRHLLDNTFFKKFSLHSDKLYQCQCILNILSSV